MTERQRVDLVELLRCAADVALVGAHERAVVGNALSLASWYGDTVLWSTALLADQQVRDGTPCTEPERYLSLLEAAARIEERAWP